MRFPPPKKGSFPPGPCGASELRTGKSGVERSSEVRTCGKHLEGVPSRGNSERRVGWRHIGWDGARGRGLRTLVVAGCEEDDQGDVQNQEAQADPEGRVGEDAGQPRVPLRGDGISSQVGFSGLERK